MDERIEILLRVNDQASRVLTQFASKIEKSTRRAAAATKSIGTAADQAGMGMGRATKRAQGLSIALNRLNRRLAGSTSGFRQLFLGVSSFVILRGAIQTMADFEQTMLAVRAVTNATTTEFELLNKKARELGATTRFTANQAAEALLNLTRAGFSVQEALEAARPALDLAVSGFLDLGTAASFVVSSVRQFGLAAQDAAHVADVLVKAANSANVTVRDLGESLKLAGPIARQTQISLEETTAALGLLGDAGLRGTLAGTGLRRLFIGLSQDTPKVRRTLESMGITLDDVDVKVRGLAAVMKTLREANISVIDAVNLFSIRGATAALVLSEFAVALGEDEKMLRAVDGEAKRISATIENSLFGAIRRAKSALQEFVIASGDRGLRGAFKGFFEDFATFFRMLAGFGDATQKASNAMLALASTLRVIPWLILAIGVGKFVGAIWTMVAAARAAGTVMAGLNAVMAASPWVALAGAVAAAVFTFNLLKVSMDRAGESARIARLNAEEFARASLKLAEALKEVEKTEKRREGETELERIRRQVRATRDLISELINAKTTISSLQKETFTVDEFSKILGFDPKVFEEFEALTKKVAQRLRTRIFEEFNFGDELRTFGQKQFIPIQGLTQFNVILKEFGALNASNKAALDKFRASLKQAKIDSFELGTEGERVALIYKRQRAAVLELTDAVAIGSIVAKQDFVDAIDQVIKRLSKQNNVSQETILNLVRLRQASVDLIREQQNARESILGIVDALQFEAAIAGKTIKEKKRLKAIRELTNLVVKAGNRISKEEIFFLQMLVPWLIMAADAEEERAKKRKELETSQQAYADEIAALEKTNRLLREEVENGKLAADILAWRIKAEAVKKGFDEEKISNLLREKAELQEILDLRRREQREEERFMFNLRKRIGIDRSAMEAEFRLTGFIIDQPTEAEFLARFDELRERAAQEFADQFPDEFRPAVEEIGRIIADLEFPTPKGLELFASSFSLQMEQIGADMTSLFLTGRDVATDLTAAFSSALSTFADEIIDDFDNIDEAFKNLGKNILKNLAKLSFEVAQRALIGNIIKGLFPGGTLGGAASLFSEKGNAFSGYRVIPFQRGGVINDLTAFTFGNKVGTAGEGGKPEAIMPLLRGRGGRLGVEVMNADMLGGGGQVNNTIIINNQPNIQTTGDRRDIEEALRKNNREIERLVDSRVTRQFRHGTFRSQTAKASRSMR